MTESDIRERVLAAIQTLRELERTILCPLELGPVVEQVVEDLGMGGVLTVRPMKTCPAGKVYVIDDRALHLG